MGVTTDTPLPMVGRRTGVPRRCWHAGDVQWSTRSGETAAAAGAAVGLGAAAVLVDPVGRVLVAAAALVLLAVVARDLLLRPRLRADAAGVTVRSLGGSRTIPWTALRTRVRATRRLGTRSRTLELEDVRDDAVLLVLGRRDLGTDPEAVAAALQPPGPPNG